MNVSAWIPNKDYFARILAVHLCHIYVLLLMAGYIQDHITLDEMGLVKSKSEDSDQEDGSDVEDISKKVTSKLIYRVVSSTCISNLHSFRNL